MRFETSYGIIPLRKKDHGWEIFLIHMNAGHWSFPKGHPEQDETGLDTAKRELLEETGFRLTHLFSEQPFEEEYYFKRDEDLVKKKVIYYLGEVSGQSRMQKEEIQDCKWIQLSEAEAQLTFKEDKKLVRLIQHFLSKEHYS